MANTVFLAGSRGHANHGWLDSHHLFSFGNYFNPDRVHFGVLRVFNDDVVTGGNGFGTHPHSNMEIISIPLDGTIVHEDSMGNTEALKPGDVQVMSAGTGIHHSEYNGSQTEQLKFLQIWLIPNEQGVEPRYDQQHFVLEKNTVKTVVGPKGGSEPLWIHQNAWLSLIKLQAGESITYTAKRQGNGLFMFLVSGTATVQGELLADRDSIGITDRSSVEISAGEDTYAVLIDLPMS